METTDIIIADCLYPSDNEWEIPTLSIEMQADPQKVDIPFVCYGETKRTFQVKGNGTLHFYTDDYYY